MESPIVEISGGKLRGSLHVTNRGFKFYTFLGIPYAKPPIGELRFRDPQPPEKWSGIRDATIQGNISSQYHFNEKKYFGDEDSLYLNVTVPSLATPESQLPVFCYIHGGGFYIGDGTYEHLCTEYLVEEDIIVVTLNYRLGIFGFLCLHTPEVPGNAGLKDQVMALKWIQKNIAFFGGNPKNVTLVGESAGSACVHYHMVSNMSRGLFVKTIMQSGTCISEWAQQKQPERNAFQLAEKLGMEKTSSKEILLKFLRDASAEDLARASVIDFDYHTNILFCGVVETNFPDCKPFIIDSPLNLIKNGYYNCVPSIHGICSHEGVLFLTPQIMETIRKGEFKFSLDQVKSVIKKHTCLDVGKKDLIKIRSFYIKDEANQVPGFIDFISDMVFTRAATTSINLMRKFNKEIFYYTYGFSGKLNKIPSSPIFSYDGAGHTDDISYIFKVKNSNVSLETPDLINKNRMVSMWTNFVKYGNPTPLSDCLINEVWEPVTDEKLNCLNIKNDLEMIENPFAERHKFLDAIFSKYTYY